MTEADVWRELSRMSREDGAEWGLRLRRRKLEEIFSRRGIKSYLHLKIAPSAVRGQVQRSSIQCRGMGLDLTAQWALALHSPSAESALPGWGASSLSKLQSHLSPECMHKHACECVYCHEAHKCFSSDT